MHECTNHLCCICFAKYLLQQSFMHSVSIMHECSSSCTFEHADTTTVVEREHVTSRKLVFVHDFSNNLYAFNVYCMHCSDLHSN